MEPSPRCWHLSAAIDRQLYVYGGDRGNNKLPTTLHVFSSDAEKWEETRPPPDNTGAMTLPAQGLEGVASTSKGHLVFLYGGRTGVGCASKGLENGCLYQLDCKDWKWTQLSLVDDEGAPKAKYSCQMIYYSAAASIVLFGGRRQSTGPSQPGAEYKRVMWEDVLTNELHIFSLLKGKDHSTMAK